MKTLTRQKVGLFLGIGLLFVDQGCSSPGRIPASWTGMEKPEQTILPTGQTPDELPQRVFIKTATQTFNRYYYFALKDGRIYHRPNDELTGESGPWELFRHEGLPDDEATKDFVRPQKIIAIHADADEITAISDENRVYTLRIESGRSWEGNKWADVWGWPTAEVLILNERVKDNLAWGIGRRNHDVLWHEDIDGNPHHFGTMGITTLYFLAANGREILFNDSGLPADFSHQMCLPKRGTFKADTLSVSASTMALLNRQGEIYTRMADFDTLGSDPMFFKYSYKREFRGEKGDEWSSNFSNWSLPAEEWRLQPPIQLRGLAQIAQSITILQNGQGNASRELRVPGYDAQGNSGYYYKQINGPTWKFRELPLRIDSSLLLARDVAPEETIQPLDQHYTGEYRTAEGKQPFKVELLDFNLDCSPARLRVTTANGSQADLLFHAVEAWTYLKRFNPGRDGTSKIYFGTIEIPPSAMEGASNELKTILQKYFAPFNHKTFEFLVQASEDFIYVRTKGARNRTELVFKNSKIVGDDLDTIRTKSAGRLALREFSDLPELQVNALESLTAADVPMLTQKLEANRAVYSKIKQWLKDKKEIRDSLKFKARMMDIVIPIARLTRLAEIEKPKLKTSAASFDHLFHAYADAAIFAQFASQEELKPMLKTLQQRIKDYGTKLELLKGTAR